MADTKKKTEAARKGEVITVTRSGGVKREKLDASRVEAIIRLRKRGIHVG